mmetsp:Transcript_24412/g.66689  ORF Transcript_24412/g.66689 Transcript_24412/m.66689 type:complete len:92 (+) Transcript_24412:1246-1521(+)
MLEREVKGAALEEGGAADAALRLAEAHLRPLGLRLPRQQHLLQLDGRAAGGAADAAVALAAVAAADAGAAGDGKDDGGDNDDDDDDDAGGD